MAIEETLLLGIKEIKLYPVHLFITQTCTMMGVGPNGVSTAKRTSDQPTDFPISVSLRTVLAISSEIFLSAGLSNEPLIGPNDAGRQETGVYGTFLKLQYERVG